MDDDETVDLEGIETEINKLLAQSMDAAYNSIQSWALVVRATSNDGDGDRHYGGLFMPPELDAFNAAGLRWLFEKGIDGRFGNI